MCKSCRLVAKRVTREVFTPSPVFLQLCTPALADSLNILKKRKKQYLRKRRRRERYKVFRAVREHQTFSKACRTRPGLEGGPSDVSQKPAAAAEPHFPGNQMTESVIMMFCFLFAFFRMRSSLQAVPEQAKRLMALSRSSSAALLRRTSMNLCTVPKANWSSWWRTSTTAPPPKHLSPVNAQHRQNQPGRTAASTVRRRCTATSRETHVTQHTHRSSVNTSVSHLHRVYRRS